MSTPPFFPIPYRPNLTSGYNDGGAGLPGMVVSPNNTTYADVVRYQGYGGLAGGGPQMPQVGQRPMQSPPPVPVPPPPPPQATPVARADVQATPGVPQTAGITPFNMYSMYTNPQMWSREYLGIPYQTQGVEYYFYPGTQFIPTYTEAEYDYLSSGSNYLAGGGSDNVTKAFRPIYDRWFPLAPGPIPTADPYQQNPRAGAAGQRIY